MVPRSWQVTLVLVGLACAAPAGGFNYVTDANGTWWGIQDAAPPRVDTGSIRATQTGPGDCLFTACVTPPYSTTINGFAGIKVLVDSEPAPRLNGEIMRGYGLLFDGTNRFTTTQSLDLGGVTQFEGRVLQAVRGVVRDWRRTRRGECRLEFRSAMMVARVENH